MIKEGLRKSFFGDEDGKNRYKKWVLGHKRSYNANPTSMKFSLQSLEEMAGSNVKVAVLGVCLNWDLQPKLSTTNWAKFW